MDQQITVSQAERKLLEYVREMGFGTLEIKVHEGVPMEILEAKKRIRLT